MLNDLCWGEKGIFLVFSHKLGVRLHADEVQCIIDDTDLDKRILVRNIFL